MTFGNEDRIIDEAEKQNECEISLPVLSTLPLQQRECLYVSCGYNNNTGGGTEVIYGLWILP